MPKGVYQRTKNNSGGGPTSFKNGNIPWNTGLKGFRLGVKRTEEEKRKISESHKGEKNYNWKGGISGTKEYVAFYRHRRRAKERNASGTHTIADWEVLKDKFNFKCPACGKKEPEITLSQDHIVPLSRGGSNDISNIQPLCLSCNSKKHTHSTRYNLKMNYRRGECRHGGYHDLKILWENMQRKVEVCVLCNKKFRWNKGFRGRVDNVEYLRQHLRNFCQRTGPTKRAYYRIYDPSKLIIHI